jgi:hypothetical protein
MVAWPAIQKISSILSGRGSVKPCRGGGNAVPGKDSGNLLVVAAQPGQGQRIPLVHDLGTGNARHRPLEEEQGFVAPRLNEDDVNIRIADPVAVDGQAQLFAGFDTLGLLPGEENAEIGDFRATAAG